MSKDLSDMTHEERMKYWEKQSKEQQKERQERIDALSDEQMAAIKMVRKYATLVTEEALHGCGVRYIYCDQFSELEEALGKLNNQFNLIGVDYD